MDVPVWSCALALGQGFAIAVAGRIRQAATVFGEEIDQAAGALEVGAVVEKAPLPPGDDEIDALQFLQVKRKRRGRYLQPFR